MDYQVILLQINWLPARLNVAVLKRKSILNLANQKEIPCSLRLEQVVTNSFAHGMMQVKSSFTLVEST